LRNSRKCFHCYKLQGISETIISTDLYQNKVDLTLGSNIYKFSYMIYLNNQQRNALLIIVAIVLGSLALKMVERQYQAMAFDLKGLLDGYKHSSRAKTENPDTAITSNVIQADTSDYSRAEKKQTKLKSGKSKQASKLKESEKININSADIDDIVRLPGIGPVLAERIIAYRDSAGPFIEADDLLNVKGIGEKKLVKIEPHLEF